MGRPGVMLYFDVRKPVSLLTDEQRGKLFLAILEYGEKGQEPDFQGELALALAWEFVMPKINSDADRYEDVVAKRKYANFCGNMTRKNLEAVSFEEWQEMDETQRRQMLKGTAVTKQRAAHADTCMPTTASTTNSTATAITATKTNTYTALTAAAEADPYETEDASLWAAAAAERKKIKMMGGKLGKGVVILSEEQVEYLLEKLDLDMFDYYVEKMADYILRTGAKLRITVPPS